jgi:hypothetical protein
LLDNDSVRNNTLSLEVRFCLLLLIILLLGGGWNSILPVSSEKTIDLSGFSQTALFIINAEIHRQYNQN